LEENMKRFFLFLMGLLLVCVILVSFTLFPSNGATATAGETPTVALAVDEDTELPVKTPDFIPPPAPTPRPDEPMIVLEEPTLVAPMTRRQALRKILDYDQQGVAKWDTPWSLETLNTDPQRMNVELVTIKELEPRIGRLPGYEDAPVWVITIRGVVTLNGPGMRCKCSGVTYLLFQETGSILGILGEGPELEEFTR
jgi:hypothetical protein